MKKFLLSFAVLATFAVMAQPAFEITLVSPANGSSIQANQLWPVTVTIKNIGNVAHAGFPADTIIYAPTFNGSIIPGIAWYVSDPVGVGATITVNDTTGIQGGASGVINMCAYMEASGAAYTATASATSVTCNDVNYDNLMAIGEMQLAQTFDKSFFSNGMYHVEVTSKVALNNPSIEVVDINGRVVLIQDLYSEGGNISDLVSFEGLAKGMYIVKLGTVDGLISINKIMN
jgi:hypothetical protein